MPPINKHPPVGWEVWEDAELLRLIDENGSDSKSTPWMKIAKCMSNNRNAAMCRNRYARMVNSRGFSRKNLCIECGLPRRGHSCPVKSLTEGHPVNKVSLWLAGVSTSRSLVRCLGPNDDEGDATPRRRRRCRYKTLLYSVNQMDAEKGSAAKEAEVEAEAEGEAKAEAEMGPAQVRTAAADGVLLASVPMSLYDIDFDDIDEDMTELGPDLAVDGVARPTLESDFGDCLEPSTIDEFGSEPHVIEWSISERFSISPPPMLPPLSSLSMPLRFEESAFLYPALLLDGSGHVAVNTWP